MSNDNCQQLKEEFDKIEKYWKCHLSIHPGQLIGKAFWARDETADEIYTQAEELGCEWEYPPKPEEKECPDLVFPPPPPELIDIFRIDLRKLDPYDYIELPKPHDPKPPGPLEPPTGPLFTITRIVVGIVIGLVIGLIVSPYILPLLGIVP
ncbi:MAG: hypothetical protein ACFFEV_03390 [Candidatus Thorarchaeota archaeon]